MRVLFPCLATLAAMMLMTQAAYAGGAFPKVVVTVAPLKPYVDDILKGHGEAKTLLRPGQDSHSFALTLPQAQLLEDADVVIVPDRSMSPFLERLFAKNKTITIIELSAVEGAYPLPYDESNPWLDEALEAALKKESKAKPRANKPVAPDNAALLDAARTRNDPHVWLDPERMAAIALPLAKAMATYAPEAKPALEANAKALSTHLRGEVIPALRQMLGKEIREMTAVDRSIIPFITYHAAYQYFQVRFRLTHYGQISERTDQSNGAKTMALTLSAAENKRIRCVIGEKPNALMSHVAKLSGARIIYLSAEQIPKRQDVDALPWMQSDYDRLLYVTAKTFASCL